MGAEERSGKEAGVPVKVMGAYSFKRQFVPFVRNGSKRHTIRGKRRHPDKPGSTFFGYYGMRTKHCEKLIKAPVIRLEDIGIYRAQVWINGEELSLSEKDSLAWRDGFRHQNLPGSLECTGAGGCFDLMLQFWVAEHGDIDFHGDVIHWDYERRDLHWANEVAESDRRFLEATNELYNALIGGAEL